MEYPQPQELTVTVRENALPVVTFVYETDDSDAAKRAAAKRAHDLFLDGEPVPFIANFFGVILSGEARPVSASSSSRGSVVLHEFNFEATRPHVPGKTPAFFCKQ